MIAFIIALYYVPEIANVLLRFQEKSSEGRIDAGRFTLWGTALLYLKTHPFFGIGWDAFKYIYQGLTGEFLNIHNVYIQLLAENGVIGALPFFAFFGITIKRLFSLTKQINSVDNCDDRLKFYVCFSLLVQVFFLTYCMTGNPLYDAPTLIVYLLSCACSEYYYRKIL